MDCALKTLREEGLLKFYTGFPTYCVRCAHPETAPVLCTNSHPCRRCTACTHTAVAGARCAQAACPEPLTRMSSPTLNPHALCRIAPHVTMTLVALEALKAYEQKIGL